MSSSIVTNNLYSYMDESSIHPLLKCKFCTKPFVDPVTTQNRDCFCRACVSVILRREFSTDNSTTNTSNDHQQSKMESLTPVTEKLFLDMLNTLLVRCTRCGEENIMRGQLDEHENETCIKATVLCTAADLKCPWMNAREELDEHKRQCKFEPLRPALEEIFNEHRELKERIKDLFTQIYELMNINTMENIDIRS